MTTATAGERAREAVGGGEVPVRWVWLAAWPVTAVFVLSNAATPLYVLWQREMGFGRGTLTVVFACYIAGLLGSLLVSGIVSDRVGRKPVLLPALGLALVACLVFATAGGVGALIAARLCTGIAVGAVVSAGMAAVTDVAGPARRRLAALLASCAMVFGAGLGPLLAGVLSETLPGPAVTVFAVEAVLLVSAVVVVVRMPVGAAHEGRGEGGRGAGGGCGCPGCLAAPEGNSPWGSLCSRPGSPPPPSCCRSARRCWRGCSAREAGWCPGRWRSRCSCPPRGCSSRYGDWGGTPCWPTAPVPPPSV